MATDLSDLDETQPTPTGPANEGDDEIRKTRLHVKNWADVEHHNTGEHKFMVGADAAQPAAGKAGRLYVNTEQNVIQRDTGTVWAPIRLVPSNFDKDTSVTFTLNTWVTVASHVVNINAVQAVIVFGSFTYQNLADVTVASMRLERNGVAVADCDELDLLLRATAGHTQCYVFFDIQPTTGTYTYEVKVKRTGAATISNAFSLNSVALLV